MATVVPVPARELLNAPGLTTAPLGDAPAGGDAAVGEAEGNNGAAGAASGTPSPAGIDGVLVVAPAAGGEGPGAVVPPPDGVTDRTSDRGRARARWQLMLTVMMLL